ncbi:MAG: restriction endonuclease subunit S [Bacteroidales bacterium]|nr:restriction endonuclease subunit S [Bacteroidales bacterium]
MNAQQLKNSILQQAIQGKLVPQDPADEPASVLLQRIRKEKERLVKEGKLKKKDLESKPIEEDEIPFEIPKSWEWCRLGSIIEFVNGRAYKKDELLEKGKYKVLRVGNFFTNQSWYYSDLELPEEKYCNDDDLLYAWSASFGPKIWHGGKTIFHYHIWNLKYNRDCLFREYLYYFFLYDKERVGTATTGSTMIHVSMENMMPRLIPIPPLAEQRRIVSKIEELMPLVERYGKAQQALDQLNESLPARLRQSILQEAIQGRLVPQDPKEESASELLKRIRKEKERLVKEGKLKKKDLESKPIEEDEIPFEIPESWEWVRIKEVICLLSGQDLVPQRYSSNPIGIPYITGASCFNKGQLVVNRWTNSPTSVSHKDDLLITCKGTVGAMAYNTIGDIHIARQIMAISSFGMYMPYMKYFMEFIVPELEKKAHSIIPGISREDVLNSLCPLPPLSEQKRIVAKVEELFGVLG